MMYLGNSVTYPFTPPAGLLAHLVMAEDSDTNDTMKRSWNPLAGSGAKPALFTADEVDIYCNKVTLDTYVFHSKDVNYDSIDHLEYNTKTFRVDVVLKSGGRLDLGVKIQWLVRPYFSKATHAYIVKTKDGKSIDGIMVPIVHIDKK
jgi:xylose isomerase